MPGRQYYATNSYRYGFNGKENDNEVKGEGNQQDYGMRIYDPRLGRFLSVDPLTSKYPELTPYQFASNTPMQAVDLDGLESSNVNTNNVDKTLNPQTVVKNQNNKDYKPWDDLINWKPSSEVIRNMNKRFFIDPSLQKIEEAYGSELNLDYYSVTINKLPNNMDKTALLDYVRTNFSDFINSNDLKFKALDKEEGGIWNSNKPVSAVMSFQQDLLGGLYTEGASVLTAKIESDYWVFSTLTTLFQDGGHPVSGNRQFGLAETENNGSKIYTFYTRGADRTHDVSDAMLSNLMWSGADKVWNRLMNNVANYINVNGGNAIVNQRVSKRINWQKDFNKPSGCNYPEHIPLERLVK